MLQRLHRQFPSFKRERAAFQRVNPVNMLTRVPKTVFENIKSSVIDCCRSPEFVCWKFPFSFILVQVPNSSHSPPDFVLRGSRFRCKGTSLCLFLNILFLDIQRRLANVDLLMNIEQGRLYRCLNCLNELVLFRGFLFLSETIQM